MKNFRTLGRLLILPLLLLTSCSSAPQSDSLAFTHVTVIDATGAPAQPDMTVVVNKDRITALGKSGEVEILQGAQSVDATGKFLIPGLWDMHVHAVREGTLEQFFPLFIANGITGVRDMGSPMPLNQIHEVRKQIAEGRMLGPRIVAAGPMVDGPDPLMADMSVGVATESEARATVKSLKERGADFIKVWSFVPRDAYFALADEAKKQGIPFAGHVPEFVTVAEASDAGQINLEHPFGILQACSNREEELHNIRKQTLTNPDISLPSRIRTLVWPPAQELLESYSEQKAAKLFRRFAENGTWLVPTLFMWQAFVHIDDKGFLNDPRHRFMPQSWRDAWSRENSLFLMGQTDAEWVLFIKNQEMLLQKHVEITGDMHQAGVRFMPGSDASDWNLVFPGWSVHDEIEMFVKAGFTPMEALQTATRNPAEFLGKLDDLGTVEEGKLADLVLLDANPLDDIRNTQKIAGVVVAGKYLDRPELDNLLAQVEAAAKAETEN